MRGVFRPEAEVSLAVQWQEKSGKWLTTSTRQSDRLATGGAREWTRLCVLAEVPKQAGRLSFMVSAYGQGPDEVVEIDDASLLELPAAHPPQSKLFRYQYGIKAPGFLLAQICADLDNDGRREILYSSRGTKMTSLLNAADGKPRWTAAIPGDHQSACAYDLDGDGIYEIVYTTSGPGRLYVLDCKTGRIVKQWQSDDSKLGNSPVIIDGDGDGVLDGYFGSRHKYLVRLNMRDLVPIKTRTGWSQCGCYTSAMDVDDDGRWDLFAGSGDDTLAKGILHRYDPITLESLWSYKTNDNASSADPVLADIDGDGKVEIIKSVDNYAGDDAHDAVYAFGTDGTLLWKVEGIAEEDSPNVADLDGDGQVEIVGMTFGGEVYCLDGRGRFRWRKDLRPELNNSAHAYMAPILCDLNGDNKLEILALTNGGIDGEGERTAFSLPSRPMGGFSTVSTWAARGSGALPSSARPTTTRTWS